MRVLYLFTFLFKSISSFPQYDNLIHYSVEDGLPSSEVYKMIQDDLGYIWFLTDRGVSRFDGYEFENFSSADGLTDNVFFDAQKLDNGSIWILGMNGSVTIINPLLPTFESYEFNEILVDCRNNASVPKNITVDRGSMFITYLNYSGFLKISSTGEVSRSFSPVFDSSIYHYSIGKEGFFNYGLENSNDNSSFNFSFWSRPTFYVNGFFIPNTKVAVLLHHKDSILIEGPSRLLRRTISIKNILDIGPLNNRQFWVSSKYNGLFIVNSNGDIVEQNNLAYVISDYFIDLHGNQWFSTLKNGVFLKRNSIIKRYQFSNKKDNTINQLSRHKNKLIVAHQNGNISELNLTENKYLAISTTEDRGAVVSYGDSLYFCVDRKLYNYDSTMTLAYKTPPTPNNIVVKGGDIFVCLNNGYKQIIERDTHQVVYSQRRINNVVTYNSAEYFASDYGLFIEKKYPDSSSLELSPVYQNRVNDLLALDSVLFLATHGEGLIIVKNDKILSTISGSAISNNYINSLFASNDSTLYLSTNSGLTRLCFSKGYSNFSSTIINQEQGLISTEVNDLELINDTLWIGTGQGLFYMPKTYFDRDNVVNDYKLRVKGIVVKDVVLENKALLDLSYTQNKLQFRYSVISFKSAKNTVYRYKLKEVDKEWIYTKNRIANYSGLSPGSYEFIVQVKGENLFWEDQADSVFVVIKPPFWRTWWFLFIAFGSGILLVYIFFKLRILLVNKDLVRELLRQILKRLKRKRKSIIVRAGNKDVKILSHDISYVKSEGNYLEIYHKNGKTVIRHKIGEFLALVPDPIEYLQIRRSYIIRIDKVDQLGKDFVITAKEKIKVGSTYHEEFKKMTL
ncbi:MAG: triple tyrosine motif-containing protein [Crocinitomicaceae bacterium]